MKRFVYDMMNPSKAGWPEPDLTVTKCCGFVPGQTYFPVAEMRDELATAQGFDVGELLRGAA